MIISNTVLILEVVRGRGFDFNFLIRKTNYEIPFVMSIFHLKAETLK